jgi:acetyl-CoA carboxylase biotin carboxyl carrier protein
MTTEPASGAAEGTEKTLAAVRRIAAEVLLDAPRPPRALRLRAGDVCLELEWPEPGSGSPAASSPVASSPAADRLEAAAAGPDPAATDAEPGPRRGEAQVCAPAVGLFYRAPQPGSAPFVTEGDQVTPGQQVAIIEVMKLMIPVEADRAGQITAALVPDGQSVEYGQPLFTLDVSG